jgi:hypothetical protein
MVQNQQFQWLEDPIEGMLPATNLSVAVLIPCYNEELTIGEVVAQFRRNLPTAVIYVYENKIILMTMDSLKRLAPPGVCVRAGYTGLAMGPFSSNLFLHLKRMDS